MLHANGVMSSKSVDGTQALQIGDTFCIPELGITLRQKSSYDIYLYEGIMSHRDICIEIHFRETSEALCLCFNLTLKNQIFLDELTKSVRNVLPLHQHQSLRDNYPPSCPCCIEKQDEIRRDLSVHPLYRILIQMEDDIPLKLIHASLFTHSVQEFQLSSWSAHWGIIYLHAGSEQYSIDLTQVYHLHAKIDVIEGAPHTILTGFNALGNRILELSQEGTYPFHQWDSELRSSTPPMLD